MNCPNCGHATPSELARCGHCNFKLPENPRPRANGPDKAIACWNCNYPNSVPADHCEHCNAKIQSPAIVKTVKIKSVPAPARASFTVHSPENL